MSQPSTEELLARQPELVFDPPFGDWINEPSPDAIRTALLALRPMDWRRGSGTAGLMWKGVGDAVVIDSLEVGWFLNILWVDGTESFLLNDQPVREGVVGVEPGNYVELSTACFSPFEAVWQAVAYWLENKALDPALHWTGQNPFPDF